MKARLALKIFLLIFVSSADCGTLVNYSENDLKSEELLLLPKNMSSTIPRIARDVEEGSGDELNQIIAIIPLKGSRGEVMQRLTQDRNVDSEESMRESPGSGEGSGHGPISAAVTDTDAFIQEEVKEFYDELSPLDKDVSEETKTNLAEDDDDNLQGNELHVLPGSESYTETEQARFDVVTEDHDVVTDQPSLGSEQGESEHEEETATSDETTSDVVVASPVDNGTTTNDAEEAQSGEDTTETPAESTGSEEKSTAPEVVTTLEVLEDLDVATEQYTATVGSEELVTGVEQDSSTLAESSSTEEVHVDVIVGDINVTMEAEESDTEGPDTMTEAKEPDTMTEAEELVTVTEAEEPDTMTEAEEPDTMTEAEEPDTVTEAEEPDTMTEVEEPDTMTEEPDTMTEAEEPDTMTEADEPDSTTEPPTTIILVQPEVTDINNETTPSTEAEMNTTSLPEVNFSLIAVDSNLVETVSQEDDKEILASGMQPKRLGAYIVITLIVLSFLGLVGFIMLRNRRRRSSSKSLDSRAGNDESKDGKELEKALLSLNEYKDNPENGELRNNEINPSLLKHNNIITNIEKNTNFSSCPKNLNVNTNDKHLTKDNNINLKNSTVADLTEVLVEQSPQKQNGGLDKCTQNTEKHIVKTLLDEDSIPKRPVLIDKHIGNNGEIASKENII